MSDEHGRLLVDAARNGDTGEVRRILAEGRADVNFAGEDGETALFCAAIVGDVETATVLVEAGADAAIADGRGDTALMAMFAANLVDLAVSVVEAGADVNQANIVGTTALILAAERRHAGPVAALLRAGADVGLVTDAGRSPLHRAKNRDIADMLLPHCDDTVVASVAEQTGYDAVRQVTREWLAGTHPIQRERRELERVLYDEAAPEMPREIASLCGEYVHRGRLAAVERGAE